MSLGKAMNMPPCVCGKPYDDHQRSPCALYRDPRAEPLRCRVDAARVIVGILALFGASDREVILRAARDLSERGG